MIATTILLGILIHAVREGYCRGSGICQHVIEFRDYMVQEIVSRMLGTELIV
jgi:hypothetical protein